MDQESRDLSAGQRRELIMSRGYLYHVTPASNRHSIQESGIEAREGKTPFGSHWSARVWLYTSLNAAYHYSGWLNALHRGGPLWIVKVDRAMVGPTNAHAFGNMRKQRQAVVWTPNAIPASAIVEIRRLDDSHRQTWDYRAWSGELRAVRRQQGYLRKQANRGVHSKR